MRILFLGLPLAAVLLHADGHTIVLVGIRSGLTTGARRLRRLLGQVPQVIDPQLDWAAFEQAAHQREPDLLVSWFFTRKIPMSVCNTCRWGGIGVHPSLLPRHRGPDPFFAAIDAGDTETGVTVHRLAEDFDTGEILQQVVVPIAPTWNAWNLAKALDRPSLRLLRAMVGRAAAEGLAQGTTQDERLATQAAMPGEEQRALNWNQPAERIVRRIRALAPAPGALVSLQDTDLVVLEAAFDGSIPRALRPGEATIVNGRAVVKALDAGVALVRAEVDGALLGPSELASLIARAEGK